VWNIKTNLIHIVLTYTIDECSRDANLLENKYILLSLLTHTKLQDQTALNILHKYSQSQKLVTDNDDINISDNYTNYEKDLLLFKETEKNMSVLFWKWEHFKKHFLLIDRSEWKLINTQQMHSLFIDDLYKNKYIIMKHETVRLKLNVYATISNTLNQFTLKKLNKESRTNHQKLYKVYANVVRLLITLSIYILRMSVQLSEADIKKSFNVD